MDKTAKFKNFQKVKSRKSNLQKDLREMKLVEIRGFENLCNTFKSFCQAVFRCLCCISCCIDTLCCIFQKVITVLS